MFRALIWAHLFDEEEEEEKSIYNIYINKSLARVREKVHLMPN